MSLKRQIRDRVRRALGTSPKQILKIVHEDVKTTKHKSQAKAELNYIQQAHKNLLSYSYYAYGLYHSSMLAKKLDIPKISAIEFGVAGGNGLVSLETHAVEIERLTGVKVETYGFDTGSGLTPAKDFRDMPYRFKEGNYGMDIPKLQSRLKRSKLVLGDVAATAATFLEKYDPAPIGFVSFDMDYYSSTMDAFEIFRQDRPHDHFLPRIQAYFDDIIGGTPASYNKFVGELAAIDAFNDSSEFVKIAETRDARKYRSRIVWYHQIYLIHRFEHPLYEKYVSQSDATSLALVD